MDLKFIKYEKRGHLAYITLNRPEVMNALHPPCHLEMDQVWDDFAADHARLGLPEPRVGLMAGAGGVHRLPRHIPLKIAMGMILTGKHLDASEAHRWGLVNEVVPLKDLMATAERWAGEIMEFSPVSIQASKEAAMSGLGMSLEEACVHKFPGTEKLWKSKDAIEGPLAFAQKRKPQWKNE